MRGPSFSCHHVRQRALQDELLSAADADAAPPGAGEATLLFHPPEESDAAAAGAAASPPRPQDWRALEQETPLRSFAAALVGPPASPLGALCIAAEDAGAFDDRGKWRIWLGAVGVLCWFHFFHVVVVGGGGQCWVGVEVGLGCASTSRATPS